MGQQSIATFFLRGALGAHRSILFCMGMSALLLTPGISWADLGVVVAEGSTGPMSVRVRVEPFPPRVGRAFFAVSVRDQATGRPAPEARGILILKRKVPPGPHSAHSPHRHPLKVNLDAAESRHPGLLGAVLDLPEAGTWSAEIRFAGSTTPAAFPFKIEVQPRLDPWIEYARALSLPVLGTLLFIWHQRRVFGKKPAGSHSQDGRRSPHP
ncbi:MAG: hypothetical protein P8M78_02450 [Myxococcota bacterium]|nr:hypothetical protein [Myxococcota bacterium]